MTKTDTYRAAVWRKLRDGKWHSVLELVAVGGLRAPARVHELRHEESRRILCRVLDGRSEYRYTCDCGPVPADPDWTLVPSCARCRPMLRTAA